MNREEFIKLIARKHFHVCCTCVDKLRDELAAYKRGEGDEPLTEADLRGEDKASYGEVKF